MNHELSIPCPKPLPNWNPHQLIPHCIVGNEALSQANQRFKTSKGPEDFQLQIIKGKKNCGAYLWHTSSKVEDF